MPEFRRAAGPVLVACAVASCSPAPLAAEVARAQGPRAPAAPGPLTLTPEAVARAGVTTAVAAGGRSRRRLAVPGTIVPDADNVARISAKTTGTVAELRKRLGDRVAKGEVVALLDSREIADAKSEYLAARVSAALQKTLYDRDQALWDKRVSAETAMLRSRASFEDLKVKVDAARRKLSFLGLTSAEIEALPDEPEVRFERQGIRSPIAGRVVERRVDLGTAVGRDNLETELYSVVDLSTVWVELAVSPGDLPLVREGQKVAVLTQADGRRGEGRIVFIGPTLDRNTRSARVVAELANPDEGWRPGSFAAAEIEVADRPARVLVPSGAVQTVEGRPTVFVRTGEGFAARTIVTGRTDGGMAEVVSGLEPGERYAVGNSFVLKAELGKPAAED